MLLGLLKPSESLSKIVFGALEDQIIGVYDYKVKTLYVRSHGNKALGLDRYTIAHEYTHALQDQHWNLSRLLPDQTPLTYRNSDAVSAHHALTEGDAVNVQTLYISRYYSGKEIAQLYAESNSQTSPPLPKAIARQFYFPYTTGVTFVKTVYNRGGMNAIDAAYRRLPSSTYEIMHPDAYLKHWTPATVSLHGVKGFDGWKQTDDDVMGAMGYQILLWQYISESTANRATDAYRGDRYIYLEHGGRGAMLLRSVWTSAATARAARAALATSLRVRFRAARWSRSGTVLTHAGGAVYLKAAGSKVTLVYGPDAATAVKLGTSAIT